MSLELSNSNQLDEDFSNYTLADGASIRRNWSAGKTIVPNRLPGGDRLEDEFGGSARYPRFSEMDEFRDGIPAKIESVGDTDYAYTPYGYTTSKSYSNAEGEEYSNFRFLGIGKRSKKQEERRQRRKDIRAGKIDSKTRHALKKFSPPFIAMRTSVLSLMRLNVVGIASAFADMKATGTDKWNQILTKWYNMGGSKKSFEKAVQKGKRKKKRFLKLVQKFRRNRNKSGFDGKDEVYDIQQYCAADGNNAAKAANAILLASGAMTVLSAAIAALPNPSGTTQAVGAWAGTGAAGFGAMGGIIRAFAKDAGASDDDVKSIPENEEPKDPPIPDDDKKLDKIVDDVVTTDDDGNKLKILGLPKNAFYIGLGVVVLIGGFFIYKKFIAKK